MSTTFQCFSLRFNDCIHQAYQIIASKVKMLAPSPDPFDQSILRPHRSIFDELSDIVDEADETSSNSAEESTKPWKDPARTPTRVPVRAPTRAPAKAQATAPARAPGSLKNDHTSSKHVAPSPLPTTWQGTIVFYFIDGFHVLVSTSLYFQT